MQNAPILRPGRHAGDRVGHVQADALLAHDDRADIGRGGEFEQMVDGIAAEDLDSLAFHDFRDSLTDLHSSIPLSWLVGALADGS